MALGSSTWPAPVFLKAIVWPGGPRGSSGPGVRAAAVGLFAVQERYGVGVWYLPLCCRTRFGSVGSSAGNGAGCARRDVAALLLIHDTAGSSYPNAHVACLGCEIKPLSAQN